MIDLVKTQRIIERYLKLYDTRELKEEDRKFIEKKLDIVLPEDFILISKYYDSYESIGHMDLFSFKHYVNDWNVVSETLKLREAIQMPKNYLVLRNENESFIAMLTQDDRSKPTPVYWIGLNDVYNLTEGKPLEDNPIIYPSFTDFFEYLVTEEENKRAEEKKARGA